MLGRDMLMTISIVDIFHIFCWLESEVVDLFLLVLEHWIDDSQVEEHQDLLVVEAGGVTGTFSSDFTLPRCVKCL